MRHGPSDYTGPLRGTTAWWHGRQDASDASQPLDANPDTPPAGGGMRHELIERVRREIAAGTYDTPEKWQAALDRMLQRLETE